MTEFRHVVVVVLLACVLFTTVSGDDFSQPSTAYCDHENGDVHGCQICCKPYITGDSLRLCIEYECGGVAVEDKAEDDTPLMADEASEVDTTPGNNQAEDTPLYVAVDKTPRKRKPQ